MESFNQNSTLLQPCNNKRKRNILVQNNKIKRNIMGENYRPMGDHINKLPDDILVNVLSHLTMKEAVRTSILSSRWRYLWKSFIGCLNFDNPLTMEDLKGRLYLKSESLHVERHKFANWVNQVLRSLRGQCIEELRICFDVVSNYDIDTWIKFASERRVQRLELDFKRVCINSNSIDQYIFPSHLDFYSLKALTLRMVSITREVLEHLLSYCPVLEVLSVTHSVILTSLEVSGPSLKLKHLKIESVCSLMDLQLHAPNLLSFEYSGVLIPVSFRNVPNLVEVSFGDLLSIYIVKNLCRHSSFLVQLRTLKLNISLMIFDYQLDHYLCKIPELCNLKHLELTAGPDVNSLLLCIAFLKASPSLYKFTLKLSSQPSYGWPEYELIETIKDHPYLSSAELSFRVVELQGFVGHASDVEFVMYLIDSAKLLEKIVIDCLYPIFVGSAMELIWRESEQHQSARKRAMELAAKFPLWEFVIP